MPLLIGLILGLFLLFKITSEKSSLAQLQAKQEAKKAIEDAWKAQYTDLNGLEDDLLKYIQDPRNYDKVAAEVEQALESMPHWKGYKLLLHPYQFEPPKSKKKADDDFNRRIKDRDLAKDIMLANRGKVRHFCACFGYSVFPVERKYELVSWIRDTLAKQEIYLEPLTKRNKCCCLYYVWDGSSAALGRMNDEFLAPFDEVINPPVVEIPSPYYNAETQNERDET